MNAWKGKAGQHLSRAMIGIHLLGHWDSMNRHEQAGDLVRGMHCVVPATGRYGAYPSAHGSFGINIALLNFLHRRSGFLRPGHLSPVIDSWKAHPPHTAMTAMIIHWRRIDGVGKSYPSATSFPALPSPDQDVSVSGRSSPRRAIIRREAPFATAKTIRVEASASNSRSKPSSVG